MSCFIVRCSVLFITLRYLCSEVTIIIHRNTKAELEHQVLVSWVLFKNWQFILLMRFKNSELAYLLAAPWLERGLLMEEPSAPKAFGGYACFRGPGTGCYHRATWAPAGQRETEPCGFPLAQPPRTQRRQGAACAGPTEWIARRTFQWRQRVISLKPKGTTSGLHTKCRTWNSGPSTIRFPQSSSSLRLRGSVPQPQGTGHNLCFSVHVKGRFRSGVFAPLTSVTLLFLSVAQPVERSDEAQGLESVYVAMVTAPFTSMISLPFDLWSGRKEQEEWKPILG